MASELSFLVDLLLNHKLPKATKEAVAARIKEVEASCAPSTLRTWQMHQHSGQPPQQQTSPQIAAQPWASTRAAMAKHEDANIEVPSMPQVVTPPLPVEVIAQTPAAAAAMASRQQAIAQAISGKIPKGQDRPRKF